MTITEANEQILTARIQQGTTVVDFWAPWCGPCRMMAPVLDEFAKQVDDVDVLKVNVDDHGELATTHKVQGIPTIIVFKDGKEHRRLVGVSDVDTLKDAIK